MIAIIRILAAAIWSILMISSSLILMLITWNRKLPVTMARHQWAPGILWICGIRMQVAGLHNIDHSKPYVFVANHQSFLDIPLLFRAIPINLYFIAKKELKKIPFLGWYMMATGMIFIDRSNRVKSVESLNQSAKLVHDGKSVILFPEGTRSKDGHLASFKKGPFVLADKADVEIIPIGVKENGSKFYPNKWGSTSVIINIGKPYKKAKEVSINDCIVQVYDMVADLSGRKKS